MVENPEKGVESLRSLFVMFIHPTRIPKRELKVSPVEEYLYRELPKNPEKGVERPLPSLSPSSAATGNPEKGVERTESFTDQSSVL